MNKKKSSKRKLEEIKFRYRGISMRSTFKPGLVLYVRSDSKKISPGDVIVFRRGEEHVVHRVNSVTSEGFRTRGDNNLRFDEFPINEKQVVGIVENVDDGKKTHPVIGGHRGLITARIRWFFLAVFDWMRPVIGAPYRWLKSSRTIMRFWHPNITRVIINSSLGPRIKYIVGGKTVATWIPELKRFQCKRFYDLIIFPPN